jgi:hypothetical protein
MVGVGLIEQVGEYTGDCVSAKQYTHVTHNVTLVYVTVLYAIGVVGFVPFS